MDKKAEQSQAIHGIWIGECCVAVFSRKDHVVTANGLLHETDNLASVGLRSSGFCFEK